MYKTTITYEDFDGIEIKEDFYFNLTEAEVAEKELTTEGGYIKRLEAIVAAKNVPAVIKVVKELLLESYGLKEGKRFRKSKEISEAFSQTNAYSKLFMKLATDDAAAAEFINHVFPKASSVAAKHPAIES